MSPAFIMLVQLAQAPSTTSPSINDPTPAPTPALPWDQLLGPVGLTAGLILLVWFGVRAWSSGTVRPGSDIEKLRIDYEQRLLDLRADYEKRLVEAKNDGEWWRGTALDALGLGEQLIAKQRHEDRETRRRGE